MIGLLVLAAHMVGDFILQTHWMAMHKFPSGWANYERTRRTSIGEPGYARPVTAWDREMFSAGVRTLHVALYTLAFVPVALFLHWQGVDGHPFWWLGLIFVTHWITDCRPLVRNHPWPAKAILVDQAVHAATLAVLTPLCYPALIA